MLSVVVAKIIVLSKYKADAGVINAYLSIIALNVFLFDSLKKSIRPWLTALVETYASS